jgi:hypothetical protein
MSCSRIKPLIHRVKHESDFAFHTVFSGMALEV